MTRSLRACAAAPRLLRSQPALPVVLVVTAGAMLLVLSFHRAASVSTDTDQTTFALYWAGYLCAMVALAALCCAAQVDRVTRTLALVWLALFGTVPRLLRSPDGPLGADEYAHMRQVIDAYIDGDVGHVSYQLPITQSFPGLHQWVAAVAHLSGLPLYTVALIVVVLAHLLSVLAGYQLLGALGASSRGAATGAVIYALNPSWVLFDTSFAYETLALPLLIWCVAGAVAAADGSSRRRGGAVAASSLAALAVPVVHHLTAIVLCGLLVAMFVAAVVGRLRRGGDDDRPRDEIGPLAVIVCCALASTTFWFAQRFDTITAYLSPSVTRAWVQLEQVAGFVPDSAGSAGTRTLFGGSRAPIYEVVSAFAFPVLVLGLVSASLWVLWSARRTIRPIVGAFVVLACLFFMSLPALFTAGGAEGAHRSWAFSFIGVAVVCGLARSHGFRSGLPAPTVPGRVAVAARRRALGSPRWWSAAACALLAVLMVGSMGAGQENVTARFAGPPSVGDDVRSINPQGAALSAWVSAHAPIDTPVLADRFASFELGSTGRMATLSPAPGFPLWDMYVNQSPVPESVLKQLYDSRIRYLVVDARMAEVRPRLGYWFTEDEPGAMGELPYPAAAISRFNCLPWLHATFGVGSLTVYEVDRDTLLRTMAGECPPTRGA